MKLYGKLGKSISHDELKLIKRVEKLEKENKRLREKIKEMDGNGLRKDK